MFFEQHFDSAYAFIFLAAVDRFILVHKIQISSVSNTNDSGMEPGSLETSVSSCGRRDSIPMGESLDSGLQSFFDPGGTGCMPDGGDRHRHTVICLAGV